MFRRVLGALIVALIVAGISLADETRGTITKMDDGSITITTGGGGFGGKKTKSEEKTFKISKDVKIVRTGGKDKEDVKLTMDELKTAMKVTNVSVTVVHDGDNGTEIKVGGRGGFGGKTKDKAKEDK